MEARLYSPIATCNIGEEPPSTPKAIPYDANDANKVILFVIVISPINFMTNAAIKARDIVHPISTHKDFKYSSFEY